MPPAIRDRWLDKLFDVPVYIVERVI